MSWPELLQVAGLSLAITLAVGGVAVLLLLALRRSSLDRAGAASSCSRRCCRWCSAWWARRGSCTSRTHDLTVAVNVAVISGVVSLALVAAWAPSWCATPARSRERRAASARESEWMLSARSPVPSSRALADELVATSAKLAESREREHRIEESRRELVAWIAHDLRTPARRHHVDGRGARG